MSSFDRQGRKQSYQEEAYLSDKPHVVGILSNILLP
jgi:hypothetical protein